MKSAAGLALLLVNVRLSHCCLGEGQILFCQAVPPAFRPGYLSLVMSLHDVGEINSTVLRSDNLASVIRLRMENAGVTGVAEGAFHSFQNLTSLNLRQNLLTEINPKWFGRPDTLRELTLTENQIQVLNESMLKGLVGLTTLSLNKNRIRAINPNSFSSQTTLADLDLSENRLTWVSPQAFSSLGSTRISLHGNPWDCSCGTEDFMDFVKGLQNRSLLDRQMDVTCDSPPSLRGQPVWNVSVCGTLPPSIVHPKPTGILPTSTAKVVTTPSSRPALSETVQPKSTDAHLIISSHTATPPARPASETKTPVQPKPTHILTTATTATLRTATYEASPPSPPSVMETSVHPNPSDLPRTISTPTGMTETCVTSRPSSDTNIVCTLVVVTAILSLLLCVACFLVVLHRRKRHNKAVTPGCPRGNGDELREDGSRSSHAQSPEHSEKRDLAENSHWDPEAGWRRSFTGVRAKSANAILFTSPFCAPVKDQATLQAEIEAQRKDTENQAEGKQKLGNDTEADGGSETEDLTNTADVNAKKQAAGGRSLDKEPHCVSVNTDAVPYLSIGTNQNKLNPRDFNKQPSGGPGQRSQTQGKVMGRISTWPPTAIQWQARCKMKEEEDEEERRDAFTVWTPKFPGEVKTVLNKVEQLSGSDGDQKGEEVDGNQKEDPLKVNVAHMKLGHSRCSKPNDRGTSVSEARVRTEGQLKKQEMIQDPGTGRQTISENPAHKSTEESSNEGKEPKRAATSRKRAENRSTGSKAPSGGASPDDETLLSGNEYAFVDLLQEVVQNNGRWTRERWKKIHVNKQRH